MEKRKSTVRSIKSIALLAGLICILTIGGWLVYYLYSWRVFDESVQKANPEFDKLNREIYETLPIPQNTVLDDVDFQAEIPYWGRMVSATYKTQLTFEEIVNYYGNLLNSSGWKEYENEADRHAFIHGTSCISVSRHQEFLGEYHLKVWNDYWRQDFSPQKPPAWLLKEIRDLGGGVLECP